MSNGKSISFLIRGIVAISILLLSFALVGFFLQTKPMIEQNIDERASTSAITINLHPIPIQRQTVGYGLSASSVHADVPAEVTSTVSLVAPNSKAGRQVSKGDLILELNSSDYRQKLVQAEQAYHSSVAQNEILHVERKSAEERAELANFDLDLAQIELERVELAFQKGAANQREVDIARQKVNASRTASINAREIADKYPSLEEQSASNVKSLQAAMNIASLNVQRCKIVSPIDGVLQQIFVDVGEHVMNGFTIARVVSNSEMEVSIRFPSYARSFIHRGDPVIITSSGFGNRVWESRITRIAPEDQSTTRTMVAFADLSQVPESTQHLPAGLFVKAIVTDQSNTDSRIIIPRRSIREDKIIVEEDGVIKTIPVEIDYSIIDDIGYEGLPDYDWAVLKNELPSGTSLILVPSSHLRDGMQINPLKFDEGLSQ